MRLDSSVSFSSRPVSRRISALGRGPMQTTASQWRASPSWGKSG